jgi:hypothetical protein
MNCDVVDFTLHHISRGHLNNLLRWTTFPPDTRINECPGLHSIIQVQI